MGIFRMAHEHIFAVNAVIGFAVGMVWWVFAFKMALEKQYRDFRIALIAR